MSLFFFFFFFFSSRRRHTRSLCDWSSDVCSSDLTAEVGGADLFESVCRSWRSPSTAHPNRNGRSEERRVGKSVDLGGRRILKKKKKERRRRKYTLTRNVAKSESRRRSTIRHMDSR